MPFARRVIEYRRRHGRRGLPWQRPRTLYRVWVSEVMLQQTQVATVVPYFRRFVRAFPNVKQLAEAPLDAVLAHWSGLGYYRRARHLHQAARCIRAGGGRLPRTVEGWMSLPGVGRSTAGAIVSLALDRPAPMLDGNARRVIARHQGQPEAAAGAGLWRIAEQLLPDRDAAAYTQGLMDLGAQVCTPRQPECGRCPLAEDCRHAVHGSPAARPVRAQPDRRRLWLATLQACDGQVLLQRRDRDGIWGGLWSLPEFGSRGAAQRWAAGRVAGLHWAEAPALVHRLSHLTLHLRPLHTQIRDADKPQFAADGRWFDPQRPAVGMAAPVRRLLESL